MSDATHDRPWVVRIAICCGVVAAFVLLSVTYLLSTSPYARDSIIEPAFSTSASATGQISLKTNYAPRFITGPIPEAIGLYKQAVSIFWDRLTSPKMPAGTAKSITGNIYALRFNPAKAYLISGDQFDDLYLRNLSVFYQDLLNPSTFSSVTDRRNRERIAVQSLAYGLASLQQLHKPYTTLSPISPTSVIAFNVYEYPSDTMFSLFQLIENLKADPDTSAVAQRLQTRYRSGLKSAYENYLSTVTDPQTGLVKRSIRLSGARDAALRQSSFYDNVILWKTQQLATSLGFDNKDPQSLSNLRSHIITTFWDNSQGHFKDDLAPGDENSYSSDWLIALPTGFLSAQNPEDLAKLERISSYIDAQHLANPVPIRYTNQPDQNINPFVKFFAGSYGTTATWSYWGDLYIDMQASLYEKTGDAQYNNHAEQTVSSWQNIIVRDRGYPETLNASGKMYGTLAYESIRRNGWIVDYWASVHNLKLAQASR